METIKFIVYINEQSTKPLVHSIAEAKEYATRNIEYKPSLKIECYCAKFQISEWIYDYQIKDWIEQLTTSDATMYQQIK
jgi:hypothetical protein